MKKLLIVICTIGAINLVNAQVGIGTTNPQSALDIQASNTSNPTIEDGILIPRIAAFPASNPTATQHSMIVYLTTTDGSSVPGFYYWNNSTSSWTALGSDATIPGWELTGNAGTTNGTNFIGTTDSQALDIRTNDVIRARFTTSGQLEILNTGQSVIIGEGAGAAHDNTATRRNTLIGYEAGNDITTAVNNTVIGWRAMDAATDTNVNNNVAVGQSTLGQLTSGQLNVAIGTSALASTGTANGNVAVGQNALSNSITSENNVAVGQAAGANADGGDNVFLGKGADAFNNFSGATRNVIIGSEAGDNGGSIGDNMSGRIIIGYRAGNNDGNSNRLYIENSSSTTPLIYGEFDTNIIRIGGQLQVGRSDGTVGSIYAFPTTDGTNGQVLTTNGAGAISWANAASSDTQDLSIDNTTADLSLVDGGTVEIKTIADSDDDTLVQVEEGTDDDLIRFDIEGVEHFTMNARGNLEVFNTGQGVFIGEGAGAAHDNSATRRNTLIGFEAGNDITTAVNNTVIGWRAMDAATDTNVNNNVAIGQHTLGNLTSGSANVAVGVGSLNGLATSNNNVAIGQNTLSNSTAGNNNVAVGKSAGANMDADDNVFIGADADNFNTGVNGRNVIIGTRAGESGVSGTAGTINYTGRVMIGYEAGGDSKTNNTLFIENSASATPLIYGEFDTNTLRVGGQLEIGRSDGTAGSVYAFPTTDGTSGQVLTTNGSGVVTWTTAAAPSNDWTTTGNSGTTAGTNFIGTTDAQALDIRTNNIIHQRFTTDGRLEFLNTGGSIMIGEGTGTSDDGTDNENVFIGKDVAPNVSTGSSDAFDSDDNVGVAREALNSLTSGTNNIAIGRESLETITTNRDNIAIGTRALRLLAANDHGNIAIGTNASLNRTSGAENTIIGYNAAIFNVGTGNSNAGYGGRTLQRLSSGSSNTAIGYNSGSILEDGSYNTLIGRMTASGNTLGEVDPGMKASVIIGDQAGGIAHFNNLFVLDNSIGTTPLLSGVFANDYAFGGGGIKDQGPYDDNRLGINIDYSSNAVNLTHTLTVGGSVKINTLMNLNPSTAPASPDRGDVYYDDATNKVRVWTGSAWEDLN